MFLVISIFSILFILALYRIAECTLKPTVNAVFDVVLSLGLAVCIAAQHGAGEQQAAITAGMLAHLTEENQRVDSLEVKVNQLHTQVAKIFETFYATDEDLQRRLDETTGRQTMSAQPVNLPAQVQSAFRRLGGSVARPQSFESTVGQATQRAMLNTVASAAKLAAASE